MFSPKHTESQNSKRVLLFCLWSPDQRTVSLVRMFEMILRGPMMCTSFEDMQELITRSQFAKYYASKRQYCHQVSLYQASPRFSQKPQDFPRFSEFDDPKGWCGRGTFRVHQLRSILGLTAMLFLQFQSLAVKLFDRCGSLRWYELVASTHTASILIFSITLYARSTWNLFTTRS